MSEEDNANIKASLNGFEIKLEENLKFIATQFKSMNKQFESMNKRFAGKWLEPIVMLILGTLLGMLAFPFFAAGAESITAIVKSNIS